jgi:predicted secreted protein
MPLDLITVAVDDEFTISLTSIATTGYVWNVESDPDAIQLLGRENETASREAKPGDSSSQIFRFRAHKTGEHKIVFELGRPWENKAIETKTVTVKVN